MQLVIFAYPEPHSTWRIVTHATRNQPPYLYPDEDKTYPCAKADSESYFDSMHRDSCHTLFPCVQCSFCTTILVDGTELRLYGLDKGALHSILLPKERGQIVSR